MYYDVATAVFALFSVILVFLSMIYPAWFQQVYKGGNNNVFQGFGLWAFYSSSQLSSPFLAPATTLPYKDFCASNSDNAPNWMYGAGDGYHKALCGGSMLTIQVLASVCAVFTLIILIAAIVAVYRHQVGIPEKIVSGLTLVGALLYSIALIVWGWMVQQSLYQIDTISQQYQSCKVSSESWSCWFYGNCFWEALGSIVAMSITGYFNSASRSAKVCKFRVRFEQEMSLAVQASLQDQHNQQENVYSSAQTPARFKSSGVPSTNI